MKVLGNSTVKSLYKYPRTSLRLPSQLPIQISMKVLGDSLVKFQYKSPRTSWRLPSQLPIQISKKVLGNLLVKLQYKSPRTFAKQRSPLGHGMHGSINALLRDLLVLVSL